MIDRDPMVTAARKRIADRIKAQRRSFKESLAIKILTPKTRRRGTFKKFTLL